MIKKGSSLKEMMRFYGITFVLFMAICFIAYRFVEPAPPRKVTIATGSKEGKYYAFAEQYKNYFARENIELQIVETSGSVDNLRLLEDGKVEVAFLQGGVGQNAESPDLRGLASLYFEPLFIFVRADLQISTLAEFSHKRLGVGPDGSGTRQIAMQLLADNNLTESKDVILLPSAGKEGATRLLAGEIDALFMVTGIGAELVDQLLHDSRVTLLNLRRAEAYSRLHKYLSHISIPQGLFDMADNIPDRDIHLVAPAATLVCNDLLHPALIDLFMQLTETVHKEGSLATAEGYFPSAGHVDFPLSKEAERYFKHGPPFLQRYLPFWAASLIDRLKFMLLPLIALLIPLIKILPPVYRWRIRSRIYRWYDQLLELDAITARTSGKGTIEQGLATLDKMEDEVRAVEVPLSYAEELYHLRLHIDLLRKQFLRSLSEKNTESITGSSPN